RDAEGRGQESNGEGAIDGRSLSRAAPEKDEAAEGTGRQKQAGDAQHGTNRGGMLLQRMRSGQHGFELDGRWNALGEDGERGGEGVVTRDDAELLQVEAGRAGAALRGTR